MSVVNLNRKIAGEQPIIRVDGNTSEKKFLFLGNDTGDISDNTKVIMVSVVLWEMYVEIKVTDTGKGISESNQAAFVPYRSTSP